MILLMFFDTVIEKLIKLDVSDAKKSVGVGLDYINSIIILQCF